VGSPVPITLVTTFFAAADPQRRAELADCVRRNIDASLFETVVLANEGSAEPFAKSDGRLFVEPVDQRPTFRDLLALGADHTDAGQLLVIANTDICFDGTVRALADAVTAKRSAALSRWQCDPDGSPARLHDHNDSQDVWVFRTPVPTLDADFCPGIPRCDNRLIELMREADMDVINPAFSVRTYHHHADASPVYGDDRPEYVQGPYGYVWPHNLHSFATTLAYNATHPGARLGYRFDRRRFRRSAVGRAVNRVLRKNDAWWGFHSETKS